MTHGTLTGYVDYKCRCEDCRKRYSEWQRERRRAGGPAIERERAAQRERDKHNRELRREWAKGAYYRRKYGRRPDSPYEQLLRKLHPGRGG